MRSRLASRAIASDDAEVERTRSFLCGYRLCLDMLRLHRYERRLGRGRRGFDDPCDCEDILSGNEGMWRARMYEVSLLLDGMPPGREKLMLYYHYIRGESIERTADLLSVSRRTGYRLHRRALITATPILQCMSPKSIVIDKN